MTARDPNLTCPSCGHSWYSGPVQAAFDERDAMIANRHTSMSLKLPTSKPGPSREYRLYAEVYRASVHHDGKTLLPNKLRMNQATLNLITHDLVDRGILKPTSNNCTEAAAGDAQAPSFMFYGIPVEVCESVPDDMCGIVMPDAVRHLAPPKFVRLA